MHYLALVGEQPMPILMPLWQLPGITDLQFIATKTTKAIANRLEGVVRTDNALKGVRIHEHLLVDAYQMTDTLQKVSQAIYANQYQRVLINITSGTKIMSLACLQAAQAYDCELLYLSTQTRGLLFFHPASKKEWTEKADISIDCRQYFNAHGFDASLNLNFKSQVAPVMPPKEGDQLENHLFELCKNSELFDDVQKNLYVRNRTPSQPGVINELDIVVTHNGTMAICSCKSGKLVNDPLYELSSLASRELAGIYCKKFLVTSHPENAVPQGIKDRAAGFGVQIISSESLEQSAQIIFDSIR